MGKPKPPVSLLWDKYSFNPLTGRFHTIHGSPFKTPFNKRKKPGAELAGNIVSFKNGRLATHQLSINGEHRYPYGVCVFAWLHGRWPADGMEIDHINHNPFDHRIHNLREITGAENTAARRAHGMAGSRRALVPGIRRPAWQALGASGGWAQKSPAGGRGGGGSDQDVVTYADAALDAKGCAWQ